MKKIIIKILISFVSVLVVFAIYFNTNFFIRNQDWKYNDGFHIGDWVQFSNKTLNHNDIINGDTVKAKVVFCFGKRLIIEDVKTGERGIYTNKSW